MDRDRELGENPANDEKRSRDASVRRPYTKPELRRLGSVRELTFGTTMGNFGDLGGMMTTPM